MFLRFLMVWGVLLSGSAIAQLATYKPGPENVALPPDYATNFVRYATVDRADLKAVRYVHVNPEAFQLVKKGEPFPNGTVVVLDQRKAKLSIDGQPLLDLSGRYIPEGPIQLILVQEKRKGWGVGYPDHLRNGEWDYARFSASGVRAEGSVETCLACHTQNRKAQDFIFTLWDYAAARR